MTFILLNTVSGQPFIEELWNDREKFACDDAFNPAKTCYNLVKRTSDETAKVGK
jgi:hypothetical protein